MIKSIVLFLSFLTLNIAAFSQQWITVQSPNPHSTRNILRGAGSISSNDVWAVGESGLTGSQTLTQHWDGVNWTIINSPSPGSQYNALYAVKGLSSDNVYAVGDYTGHPATPQMLVL